MAKIYLHEGSLTNPQTSMDCVEFDIVSAAKYPGSSQTNFRRMISLPSGLDRPYVSMRFHGSHLTFAVQEDGTTYRINLIDFDSFPAPFVEDLKLGVNIRKPQEGDDPLDNNLTWINFTKYDVGYKPPDWDTNWFNYYTFSSGRWYPVTSSTYVPTNAYYYAGDHTKMFYVDSGLYSFRFGVSTKVSKTPSSNAGSGIFTGAAYSGNYSGVNSTGTDALTFTRGESTIMVPRNLPLTHQFIYAQSITAGSQSIWCQTYPVHFVIPAGMVISSSDGYGSEGNTFRATKNTSFFGLISIYFNSQGEPSEFAITAMEDIAWKSETLRKNDYGDDTLPTGGKGPQKIGKYNPKSQITRARNGGILTDPTAGKGFVIYKMTQAEFIQFMNGLYNQLALPSWALDIAGNLSGSNTLENLLGQSMIQWGMGGGNKLLSNIVFVKNSPVSFPSVHHNLGRISIGSQGIAGVSIDTQEAIPFSVDVVQGNTMEFDVDVLYDNNANSFTDVEPYKTANIYCPLVGEMQVMPSYLENARITGTIGFNLLNDAAVCALQIQGDNGVIRVSKSGQCTKPADVVLTGDGTADALSKLIPVAAAGVATIATGGTTAPALATTAVGAATGFIEDSTTMNVVNVPSSAAGNAYDECVYGGLRTMYLTSVKAERFVSAGDSGGSIRSAIMGEYSYTYLNSIGEIPEGNYVSFYDVYLQMGSGMTKAEYDKIVSYLKEGVYT